MCCLSLFCKKYIYIFATTRNTICNVNFYVGAETLKGKGVGCPFGSRLTMLLSYWVRRYPNNFTKYPNNIHDRKTFNSKQNNFEFKLSLFHYHIYTGPICHVFSDCISPITCSIVFFMKSLFFSFGNSYSLFGVTINYGVFMESLLFSFWNPHSSNFGIPI